MRKLILAAACLLVAPAVVTAAAPRKEPVTINANDIKWGDAPPDFPKGAKFAVLFGDPAKPAPFVLRLKMPDGYKIPPHSHSMDEQLTILSGTFVLHLGDTMDAPAQVLTAGGFHFLPAKTHHSAEAKGEVIVQVNGTGPFDIHPSAAKGKQPEAK